MNEMIKLGPTSLIKRSDVKGKCTVWIMGRETWKYEWLWAGQAEEDVPLPPSQTSSQPPRRSASAPRRCPVCSDPGRTSSLRVELKPWRDPPLIGQPPAEKDDRVTAKAAAKRMKRMKKSLVMSAVRKGARWHRLRNHRAAPLLPIT